jgi:hypothetical protein
MTATRASTSRNQCVCREGHYRLDGAAGEPCYACPNGAECHGGSNAPFAAMGYWGDWPAVVEAATRDGRVVDSDLLGAIHTFSFRKCLNALHCTNDCGALVTDDPAGTVVEALETLRACRSNTSHICDPRYTDNLCSLCSPGFFSLGGQCLRCLEPAVPFVTGCVLLIIAAWYLINRCAPAALHCATCRLRRKCFCCVAIISYTRGASVTHPLLHSTMGVTAEGAWYASHLCTLQDCCWSLRGGGPDAGGFCCRGGALLSVECTSPCYV